MFSFPCSPFGAQSGTTEDGWVFLPQIKARVWERKIQQQRRENAYMIHRCASLMCLFTGVLRGDNYTVWCPVEDVVM